MGNELLNELTTTNQEIAKIEASISEKIATFQNSLTTLKEKDSELRAKIKETMSANDVKKLENDFLSITYVASTSRVTFDTTRFKAEKPEEYLLYVKESAVSDSIRIKIKG